MARDFGRNGSFLLVRQLAQDVDGFEKFTVEKARELVDGGSYDKLSDLAGAPIDGG